MSTYLWNRRSLGNATTVSELQEFAREFAPSILRVVETQFHKSRVECLAGTLGYENVLL